MDENGAQFGLARPYGDADAPHVALASSPEAQRRIGGMTQNEVDQITKDLIGATATGDFMDFDKYVADKTNPQPPSAPTAPTAPTVKDRIVNTGNAVVREALGFLNNPIGTIGGMLGRIFGGGGTSSPTAPRAGERDPKAATTTSNTNDLIPATDLFATATAATETGNQTATSTEYKFGGSVTRVIFEAEDGIKTTDINANYADTVTTSLSIDYQCDSTVNANGVATLAYTAFDVTQDTSRVLMSVYVPVTEFGTHCFYFTTDTQNVVREKDESNNKSNVYRFIVGEI
jgi:hypothetical protein